MYGLFAETLAHPCPMCPTGSSLSLLAPCKQLHSLNLSHCSALGSLEALRLLPSLRRLEASHCAKLGVGALADLTGLTRLSELKVCGKR